MRVCVCVCICVSGLVLLTLWEHKAAHTVTSEDLPPNWRPKKTDPDKVNRSDLELRLLFLFCLELAISGDVKSHCMPQGSSSKSRLCPHMINTGCVCVCVCVWGSSFFTEDKSKHSMSPSEAFVFKCSVRLSFQSLLTQNKLLCFFNPRTLRESQCDWNTPRSLHERVTSETIIR